MTLVLHEPALYESVMAHAGNLALVLMACALIGLLVTVAYPWDPITKLNLRVLGAPTVGEDLTVELDYCKTRAWVPASVRWALVNDVAVSFPSATTFSMPVGCHVHRLLVPAPRHVAPGIYMLQEEVLYQPWPWREFTYVRQSPPFVLLPKLQEATR